MSDSTFNREEAPWLSFRPVRDGLMVGLVLFLVALVGIFTTHQRGAIEYEREVRAHLLDVARAAALLIDGDEHAMLQSPEQEGSEHHHRLIAPLHALLESMPIVRHVYTMVMIDDRVYFVLDAPSPSEPNDDVAAVMELYEDADPEMLEALRTGRELVTKDFYSDQWGTFISAYVPLRDSDGDQIGIVGVDMTAEEFLGRMAEMRRAMHRSVGIALLLSVLGGLAAGLVRRAMRAERRRREELIATLRQSETTLHGLLGELEERAKENETLIRVLNLMHEHSASVPGTLQAIADVLPSGFRAPSSTAARIRIGDETYHSASFQERDPNLAASFRCDDGTRGHVEIVLLDSDDAPLTFLAEERQLVRTVADSLRSYLDRQRVEEQLRQHKIVVDNSNTVLFRWRLADGWPVDLATENVHQFGYTAADLLDGTISFESIVHPEDRRQTEREVLEALENGVNSLDQQYRIVCRDGSVRWVYDRTTAERDEMGTITHIQGIVIDVTERVEAEQRLRESEDRLQRIASQVPGALYQFRMAADGTRSFPYISDGITELCGITRAELDGDPTAIMNTILPEEHDAVEASIIESAKTMRPWKTEFRIRHRDGSIRWIAGSSVPDKEPDGSIVWHGLIIDITHRKQAEEQLHRLTAIIEHTPDLVGMCTANLEPIYFNPAGRRMLEVGRYEELGETRLTDYFASSASHILERIAIPSAMRDGVWIGEAAFLQEDGRDVPVSLVIVAHKDADGKIAYLSIVSRDMSRQKFIEEDLRRSQQFLRSTLDALSAHIAIIDREGRIIEVNDAWRDFAIQNELDERHFGVGTNYIRVCEDARGEHAEDADEAARGLRQILSGEIDRFELEYPCHGPEEKRWFALRASYFNIDHGRCAVVAHENITASRMAAEQLERARDAAEAASRAKSEFLANMSHEIRTPMTAILGYTDLVMESRDDDERQANLDVIRRNGNHLLDVINDILDISKIESGRMTAERVSTSPAAIIADVVSLMRVRAIEKNLSLDLEYPTEIPESIHTDPVRFRQILLNLIGNAIKFTIEGGVQVVARFDASDASASGGRFVIEIHDTGIGLSHEQIANIFRPFVQGDSSMTRRFGGTGLGLAISRRLARLLGGDIEVASTGDRGSTFMLCLPVELSETLKMIRADPGAIVDHAHGDDVVHLPKLDCRILLAEDGLDNQQLLSFMLRKAGADVTIVGDGQAAMNLALEAEEAGNPFDLILMDMQMPVMDGYTATRRLRERGYEGLIVALTAHAMVADRERCLAVGCDEYLMKPIDRASLIKHLYRCLNDRDIAA
jgi:PAS domain S-box-containing protein